jgi:hypothetical protein
LESEDRRMEDLKREVQPNRWIFKGFDLYVLSPNYTLLMEALRKKYEG